jgi:hypothetical protein
MPLLVGGVVAAILGLLGLIEWRQDFLVLVKGALPLMILLGGMLAIYVGIDDLQEKARDERERQANELERAREEIEQVRSQTEFCRQELERLKGERSRQESS